MTVKSNCALWYNMHLPLLPMFDLPFSTNSVTKRKNTPEQVFLRLLYYCCLLSIESHLKWAKENYQRFPSFNLLIYIYFLPCACSILSTTLWKKMNEKIKLNSTKKRRKKKGWTDQAYTHSMNSIFEYTGQLWLVKERKHVWIHIHTHTDTVRRIKILISTKCMLVNIVHLFRINILYYSVYSYFREFLLFEESFENLIWLL